MQVVKPGAMDCGPQSGRKTKVRQAQAPASLFHSLWMWSLIKCGCHPASHAAQALVSLHRRAADVFVDPIQVALHDVENELRLLRAMRGPGTNHHLRFDTLALQGRRSEE